MNYALKKYFPNLSDEQVERYTMLESLYPEWNEKINVTAIREPSVFLEKNIIDSLSLFGAPELSAADSVLDMGTGGGYPWLPLAAVCPDKRFVLTDAIGKKLKVVDVVALQL
jgi:16S rRNA (guanine527-N7)-methyltransferase